jgi:hypothetical protein
MLCELTEANHSPAWLLLNSRRKFWLLWDGKRQKIRKGNGEMKLSLRIGVALAVVLLAGTSAQAVTFSGIASGQWTNVVSTASDDIYGVVNNDIGSTAVFSWGASNQSSTPSVFTFDGVGSDGDPGWSASSETPFSLGDFSYYNGSSSNATGVDGVTLDVLLTVISPLSDSETYAFDFTLVNTTNHTPPDPVADADIVTSNNAFSATTFTYGGVNYTLELLGFSSDGGTTIRTDFSSPEGGWANADVYARITSQVPNVPEPTTMVLLGLGFASLALRRLHRA